MTDPFVNRIFYFTLKYRCKDFGFYTEETETQISPLTAAFIILCVFNKGQYLFFKK